MHDAEKVRKQFEKERQAVMADPTAYKEYVAERGARARDLYRRKRFFGV